MNSSGFSKLANAVISVFEKEEAPTAEKKISVNPMVSKVATWYEKLRNVMEYREEEVILRAAIERILKRRLILGGSGKTTAEPLIRELAWARYFPDNTIPESIIEKVEEKIDLYLFLREKIILQHEHRLSDKTINDWTFHLMSSDIEKTLSFNKERETMSNFMFHIMRNNILIIDDSEETKDAQVFIAVRKSFAKDDLAFLRFHLFNQVLGRLTKESAEKVASSFWHGYLEIQKQLNYPRKDRIFSFVKDKTAIFFVLEDVLHIYKERVKELAYNEDEFKKMVFKACEKRYAGISSRVKTAIIRSVLFILITKSIFALTLEGSFERMVFGKVMWRSLIINTSGPAILMLIVGLFIRTPDKNNSVKIFDYIKKVLFEEKPILGEPLEIKKQAEKTKPILAAIFTLLWFLAFILSFGAIIYVLTRFGFNVVSQGVFLFFAAIVSFLSYRIWLTSKIYSVDIKQGLITPLIDFLYMPIVRVGRKLTEGISQLNFILFIFDFVIETPFKGLFAFFEQWFFFLRSKSEELE